MQDVKTEIVYDGPLEAPIKAGTEIGRLVFTVPGQLPVETPLVTMDSVEKLGFMGRVFEGLNRLMTNTDEG